MSHGNHVETAEGSTAEPVAVLDFATVAKALPHRYPFLLLDKVLIMKRGEAAIGIKAITNNEPQFTGHFPGNPVFPGVYLIEALAQTGIVLWWDSNRRSVGNVLLRTVDGAKFREVVSPGCILELHVELMSGRHGIYRYQGRAITEGREAARCSFSAVGQR